MRPELYGGLCELCPEVEGGRRGVYDGPCLQKFPKMSIEMFVIVLDHHTCLTWDGAKANLEPLSYSSHSFYQFLHIFGGTCPGYHSIARPEAQRLDSTASTTCRSVTRINLPRTPSAGHPLINTTRSV